MSIPVHLQASSHNLEGMDVFPITSWNVPDSPNMGNFLCSRRRSLSILERLNNGVNAASHSYTITLELREEVKPTSSRFERNIVYTQMFQTCMDTFWEFCSGVRKKLLPDESNKVQRSESPITAYDAYDCSNITCINSTKDISTWKIVKTKTYMYCMCSQDCYDEWLNRPFQSPWSSPVYKIKNSTQDIPPLELE